MLLEREFERLHTKLHLRLDTGSAFAVCALLGCRELRFESTLRRREIGDLRDGRVAFAVRRGARSQCRRGDEQK